MGYYVSVEPGIKIYVEDINPNGCKTIVFLHGWPANHRMFEYQFNELSRMGYRCIGIDFRGYGKSDKPYNGYDYNRLSDDIRCVVEKLDLQNFILGGHSTGGAVAIRYMSRHKGCRVAKLALFAAAAPSLIQKQNFPHGLPKETVEKIIEDTSNDRPKMLEGFGNIFFFQYKTAPFMEWFFQMGLEAAGWSTIAIANSWLKETLFTDIEKVCVPTLILHGVHDKVVPFPLATVQHEGIRNSRFVPFKYSGHGLLFDQRDKFNKELVQFIEE